jgi:predicted DsbA family dithiol-disulfide isomerase
VTKLRIDIWSDIACPWCYVGKRRLEAALTQLRDAELQDTQLKNGTDVEVVWRAFELDPSAPAELPTEPAYVERLARKYRTSTAGAEEMIQRMTDVAAADGLDFRFDRIRPGNTFDAHRLLHFAHEHGCQDELKERLFAAYLCEGESIGNHDTLARQAEAVGLDIDEAKRVLASDAFSKQVRAEEQEAAVIGVTGVPFFVIDGRFGVSGAQSAEVLKQVIDKASNQHVPDVEQGAACGPSGCD